MELFSSPLSSPFCNISATGLAILCVPDMLKDVGIVFSSHCKAHFTKAIMMKPMMKPIRCLKSHSRSLPSLAMTKAMATDQGPQGEWGRVMSYIHQGS